MTRGAFASLLEIFSERNHGNCSRPLKLGFGLNGDAKTPTSRLLESTYCADWLLAVDWFSSCCNWSNWRSWSTLDEVEEGLFRGLVCAKG